MGKKKNEKILCEPQFEAPETLEGCPFYGLELDNEQKQFRDAIWDPNTDIVFVNADAGTGKTTVALGTANLLVKYGKFSQIIYMVAPTQEAKIGFLPGEPGEKLAPYFLPLYDAATTLGINPFREINPCTDDWQPSGDGYIDCMTHNFLRGRNIDENTILLIDEAQNMYMDELKTVLTRVHDGTKCIVIGHTGQCDLIKHAERSGFAPYIEHFRNQPRCKICELHNNHRGWISKHADALTLRDAG